jgi:hypothetical protein
MNEINGCKRDIPRLPRNLFDKVVAIDGNSNDFDSNFQDLQAKYKFNYISENDTGIYNAMNKGIALSKTNRLLFLNSGDSVINDSVFEKFIYYYPERDLVYSNVIKVFEDGTNLQLYFPEDLSLDYMISYGLPHQATIINKSLFDKVGLYNEDYKIISDWVFFMEALFYHNASYKYINEDVLGEKRIISHDQDESRPSCFQYIVNLFKDQEHSYGNPNIMAYKINKYIN